MDVGDKGTVKLIDEEKLIHDLLLILHDDVCAPDGHIDPYYVFATIKRQPDVIRCSDCKYQDKGEHKGESWNLRNYRPWQHTPTTDNHYCGYAKRKDTVNEEDQANGIG